MASYGDDDAAAADSPVTLSATVYTLRREVEEVSLEKIQLLSQLRLQEHDVRDARSEAARLTELIESVQAQHQERVAGLLEEREKQLKRCRIAEDTAAFCEQALAEANGELEASLAERETLAKVANGLMKDKEERLLELHLAQDRCDELQGKHDKLETEREHDLEEIAALRRNVEFNDQYIKNLHESRQRLDEHARRLQAELQEVVLRCDAGGSAGGGGGGASALAAMDFSQPLSSLPPPLQQQQQPQSSLPMDGSFDPMQQAPQGNDPAYYDGQQESMYPRGGGGGGGGGGYDDGYGGADDGGAFVRDPMSPARLLRADEDAAYARQSDEYPQEEAASPRNREYEEEMGRLGMKLERLCTDVHTTRVEDQYVQTEYMIEASTRLNGALAALEQLCAIIADWKASISCGREPWGSLESKEQELTARRLRDIERRAAMKQEVTRTLERTGMGSDAVACLEVHFASGRVRDAVTYAVEGFQASKEAADTCMGHAKRTIEESVEAARAQAELIGLSKGDAGQMDEKLKELTNTKFQAENEIESLKRERDAYQKEVERLSGLMKQEAQDDRQKMSQIAMDMTEKQQAELMKMGDVHRKEVAEMTRTHVAKVEALHASHTEELARLSAEVQQHKDAAEAMRKALDEKDRQLEGEVAKKKTAKNAREQMSAELSGLKQVMSMMGRENKEVKGMVKAVEKENLVLKELSTKLESDVRRGRIMMEGENTRSAFEAWRSSRAGGAGDSGSPHGTLPPPPAPSSRADSHSQMRSRSQAMYPNPDKKSRTRDYMYYNASSPPQALKPTSLRPYIGPV